MAHRPFKPLSFHKRNVLHDQQEDDERIPDSPPPKKQCIEVEPVQRGIPTRKVVGDSNALQSLRKPLLVVNNPIATQTDKPVIQTSEGYYLVLWSVASSSLWLHNVAYNPRRKFTNKKHKTWDDDGVLSVSGGYARLQGKDGRELGRCMYKDPLLPGSQLSISGKEVEVDSIISKTDYLAGKPFLGAPKQHIATPGSAAIGIPKTLDTTPIPRPVYSEKPPFAMSATAKRKLSASGTEMAENHYTSLQSVAMRSKFKTPLQANTVLPKNSKGTPRARHDPTAPGAVVMKRLQDVPKGKQLVDVVLDPFLGRLLRQHQKEGVKFMYECVMGLRSHNGEGAILADEVSTPDIACVCMLTILRWVWARHCKR